MQFIGSRNKHWSYNKTIKFVLSQIETATISVKITFTDSKAEIYSRKHRKWFGTVMEKKKQNCNKLKSEVMPRAVKMQVSIVFDRVEVPRAVPHHSQEERKEHCRYSTGHFKQCALTEVVLI